MKEELISFETSKLAKDKGFDWDCVNYFQDSHRAGVHKINNINNKIIDELHQEDKYCIIFFATPTQSLLQKWLRKVHNIHLMIKPWDGDKFQIFVLYNGPSEEYNEEYREEDCFNSYEKSLEKGLQEALKLINN